jgi:hypothetical protein
MIRIVSHGELTAVRSLIKTKKPEIEYREHPTRRGCEEIGTGTAQLSTNVGKYAQQLGASPISSQPRSESQLRRFCQIVRAYLDDLDRRRFVHRPGFGCTMCEFSDGTYDGC